MAIPHLLFKARRRGGAGLDAALVWVGAVISVAVTPLLISCLGAVVELMTCPPAETFHDFPLLGGLWRRLLHGPLEHGQVTQAALIVAMVAVILATFLSLSLAAVYRGARGMGVNVAAGLLAELHRKAFDLGATDFLAGGASRAEELLRYSLPTVQAGTYAWNRAIPQSPLLVAALLVFAALIHVWLAVTALLFTIIAWLLFNMLSRHAQRARRTWTARAGSVHTAIVEQLRQAPLATGFALSSIPGHAADELIRDYERLLRRASTSGWLTYPLLSLFAIAGAALTLFLAAHNAALTPPAISAAGIVMLAAAMITAAPPVRRLIELVRELSQYEAACEDMLTYLDRTPAVIEATETSPLTKITEKITLSNVTLSDRDGRKLLDRVSLELPAGKRIAVVASDRQSPLALAGLLLRFYDATSGQVLLDGQDLRRLSLSSVRRHMALVTGHANVFTATVAENIRSGDETATQLQVTEAARAARALDFIQPLPDGLSTLVGEGGHRLTDSQAFRVGLARAALRDPALIVLEEPQFAAGAPAAAAVDAAIAAIAQGRSLLILPGRIETLRAADLVVLLHRGTVTERGPHADLLQRSELYRHLVYVRFNEFRGVVE